MTLRLTRRQYADLYGPTEGDRVRLADTDLFILIELGAGPHAPVHVPALSKIGHGLAAGLNRNRLLAGYLAAILVPLGLDRVVVGLASLQRWRGKDAVGSPLPGLLAFHPDFGVCRRQDHA